MPQWKLEQKCLTSKSSSESSSLPSFFYWRVVTSNQRLTILEWALHIERSGFLVLSYGGALLTITRWRQARKCSARRAKRQRLSRDTLERLRLLLRVTLRAGGSARAFGRRAMYCWSCCLHVRCAPGVAPLLRWGRHNAGALGFLLRVVTSNQRLTIIQ